MIARLDERRRDALVAVIVAVTALIAIGWSASILADGFYADQLSLYRPPIRVVGGVPGPEMTSDVTVSGSLVPTHDRLTEVGVRIATYGRTNRGPLVFTLAESRNGEPIRTVEVPMETLRKDAFHPFAFDELEDSAGREYWLTLNAPEATPGNAITLWLAGDDRFPEEDLYFDGARQPDLDLSLSFAYRIDDKSVPWELVNRMSQYKPEPFKGVGLLLLTFATFAALLVAVAIYSRRIVTDESPTEATTPWPWIVATLPFVVCVATLVW